MREIFDYKDIRRLEETFLDGMMRKGIVVTATSELERAMQSYYPQYQVFDIHDFISGIIPEWEQNIKDIKNYVMLRNVIEEYVIDNNVESTVATYLRRNAADMWNAIKLLIEADVYPDDVSCSKSEPVRRFKELWKRLEVENDQIHKFRTTFAFELSQKEKVVKIIEKIVSERQRLKGAAEYLPKDIFLFGFYFITPIQERIFDTLGDAGFHLKFVNCHNTDYPYANEIWKRAFSNEYKEGRSQNLQSDIVMDNYFGEALNGNTKEIPISIKKHYTEFEFAEMVKKAVDKGEVVYSPDAKQCEQILKEYYPDFYDRKHLLSYPVGQYIYYLHMIWNTFTNRMEMKFEYVEKCFASGWLSKGELNGRNYLYEIKLLSVFFKGCSLLEDWKKRIKQLKESKRAISGFKNRKHGKERWHRLLGDPFYNLGIYTIKEVTIDEIETLLIKLVEDAEYLFTNKEKTILYDHFQRITQIIQSHMDEDDLLQEEFEVANELIKQLNDKSTNDIVCPMNGIRDAIILLIGNHFGEYESQEEETSAKDRMVMPLSMVEAAMLNNYGQTVHLVMANEFNLPGTPKKLPWPLTDEMLDLLQIKGRERTERYVNCMRSVIDNRPMSYRYLFYTFMGISNSKNKPTLSVEWICKKENKEIDVSPYIRLLGVEDKVDDKMGDDRLFIDVIRDGNVEKMNSPVATPEPNVPDEVRMDYLLCRNRYVYSYILNYLPTYSSEFQYSFELSKLISAFSIISGVNKDIVADNIEKLFPYLRHIELRQSTDFAKSQGTPEPYLYEDVEYPAQRLMTHYINDEIIKQATIRDEAYLENGKISVDTPEKACIYCPYSEICIERHINQVNDYE